MIVVGVVIAVIAILAIVLMKNQDVSPTQDQGQDQPQDGSPDPSMAELPSVDLEATVVSLNTDENVECEGVCPAYEYPKDTGVVRIDKIISTNYGDTGLESLEGIKEGGEIAVQFQYSARPAIFRLIPAPEQPAPTDPETPVSHVPSSARPAPVEDGYFVYAHESGIVEEETDTILPGLEVGSKFRATINYISSNMIVVSRYEVMDSPEAV